LLHRKWYHKYLLHLGLLLQKTMLTILRNKKPYLVMILCPIAWCLCISFFNH